MAQKEKEKKEEHLRSLAQKAREERAGIKSGAALSSGAAGKNTYCIVWVTVLVCFFVLICCVFFFFFQIEMTKLKKEIYSGWSDIKIELVSGI